MNEAYDKKGNPVHSILASCRDCYKCVRHCPVKAIRIHDGQARIDDNLCIRCGTCVSVCPQKAKAVYTSLDAVKELIESGVQVVASIAPSFAAAFPQELALKLPTALKKLGFYAVAETAEGAKLITEKSFSKGTGGSICTACPVVVNYVERYKPDYISEMIPIVSPMIAHGRQLKKRMPGCAVVFIGPCAAKKEEACRGENSDAIDEVLTFVEFRQWLEEEGIDLKALEDTEFDTKGDLGDARLFPLQGGMLKTGDVLYEGVNPEVVHISGPTDVLDILETPWVDFEYKIIEPLFCHGGCINNPCFDSHDNIFVRRKNVMVYADEAKEKAKRKTEEGLERGVECFTDFQKVEDKMLNAKVEKAEIMKVLEATGKADPKLQLNCGACGYKNCIENARAVALGMAEKEMCMPYMKRLAQQRTDKIIESTPTGVVILDSNLCILSMNPSFCKMFMCNNSIIGRRISYLVSAEGYEKLINESDEIYEAIKTKYGIKYHELIYRLEDEDQYVGIYSDISQLKFDRKQMDMIKSQTVESARELLDHQIKFSQQMAQYLGRSTAQSEGLLKRLIELYEDDYEVF